MYLTSKHIQVALILRKSKIVDYKILTKMLNITPSTFFSYLRDIENIILKKDEPDVKILMKDLKEASNLVHLIKSQQNITKDERVLYIIFKILKDRVINVTKLSEDLNVTRRTLNYDLDKVKLKLERYNLFLVSCRNIGLNIVGEEINIRRMLLGYILKIFIEKNFLPKIIRNEFASFLKKNNYKFIKKNIPSLEMEVEDSFYYNELALISACLAFSCDRSEKENEICYINKNFSINILKVTEPYFKKILKYRYYEPDIYSDKLKEYEEYFKNIILKLFGFNIQNIFQKKVPIRKWLVFLLIKEIFEINDFYFLNILKNNFSEKIDLLTNKLKKKLPRITIYDGFVIYFFILNLLSIEKENSSKKIIFIYENIPKILINDLVKKIEIIYSVKFNDVIRFKLLGKYLKNNQVSSIYSLENFNVSEKNMNYIKISLSDILISK